MWHLNIFTLVEVPLDKNISHIRLTVDSPEDLEFTKIMIEKIKSHEFPWREIIQLLKVHQEVTAINSKYSEIINLYKQYRIGGLNYG